MYLRLKIFVTFALMSVCAANGDIIGTHTARFVADFSNALPIQFWPVECETHNQHIPQGVFYRCYQNNWQNSDTLVFQFTEDTLAPENYEVVAVTAADVQIAVVPFVATVLTDKVVYNASMSATANGFQNDAVYFVVRFVGGLNIAQSDAHEFAAVAKNTILITYYHHRNAFGLVYEEDASPQTKFYLRIPAIFYHERNPSEQSDIVLTNQIITNSTIMFKQRLLETAMMPRYMHEKIQLALQHQFVEIINKRWKKREAYEQREGNRKSPFKAANVYLNQESYVQRSVL